MPSAIRTILILLLLAQASCKVLFYSDASTSAGGTWIGTDRFVEIQSLFERKSPWFPLNQNAITRNYSTTLLLHALKNDSVTETTTLAHFDGWTLNDSLFHTGPSLLLLRGKSDSYGDMEREVVLLPFPGPGDARVIAAEESILAAAP